MSISEIIEYKALSVLPGIPSSWEGFNQRIFWSSQTRGSLKAPVRSPPDWQDPGPRGGYQAPTPRRNIHGSLRRTHMAQQGVP